MMEAFRIMKGPTCGGPHGVDSCGLVVTPAPFLSEVTGLGLCSLLALPLATSHRIRIHSRLENLLHPSSMKREAAL